MKNQGLDIQEYWLVVDFTQDRGTDIRNFSMPNIETEYKILAITQDYNYALVGGSGPDYLWMLGRDKIMPTNVYKWFQEIALEHAYNVEKLKITKG